MRTPKLLLALAGLLMLPQVSFAQLTRATLSAPGVWYAPGADSAYYQAKTLTFVSDARALPPKLCKYTTWEISAKKFAVVSYDACLSPEDAFSFHSKKKLRLSNQGTTQVLNIYRSGVLVDSFEVLAVSPTGIEDSKKMTLKRVMPKVPIY